MLGQKEKLFALLGHPVKHSLSPLMHNDQFKRFNLPYYYHAFDVAPKDLKDAVNGMRALGFSGFNVTVPHKVEVMKYIDEIEEDAEKIGAVNTVVYEEGKWVGCNTDGIGYVASLVAETGEALKDYRVLMIGAGGAARAVAVGLARYGVKELVITNRTLSKAEDIVHHLPGEGTYRVLDKKEAEKETPTFDVIINTTSIGMSPSLEETPWTVDPLKPNCLCSDLIYNPRMTKWLKEAREKGARVLNGVGMFVGQGSAAFERWTGIKPDTKRMTEVVHSHLKESSDVNK